MPVLAMLFGLCACESGTESETPVLMPRFSEIRVDSITCNSAQLFAQIDAYGRVSDVSFSISRNFEQADSILKAIVCGDTIISFATGLDPQTDYFAQALAFNGIGDTVKSTVISFTTLPMPEEPGNPDDPDRITFGCPYLNRWFTARYDSNEDGALTLSELWDATYLDLSGDSITSTGGLEQLPGLMHLNIEASHQEGVRGQLKSIDLSHGWPSLRELYIFNSSIDSLDLNYIGHQLTGFMARRCLLKSIDISTMTGVQYMDMAENLFSSLDFTGLDNLDELHIEQNPYLEHVTFDNSLLRYVDLNSTGIKSVDFSKCPRLEAVDLTGCPRLEKVVVSRSHTIGTLSMPDDVLIEYCD